jgi:ABC-type oligopeptide transport system ATPase subunit
VNANGHDADVLVSVRNLKTYYSIRGGFLDRLIGREGADVRAVDDVTLDLRKGEVLGLVGESGSGKSTLGRLLLRLIDPDAGEIEFDGTRLDTLGARQLRALRPSMQIVLQNPYAALNPRLRIGRTVGFNLGPAGVPRAEHGERIEEALRLVGLGPEFSDRLPHQLSGGQAQRVGIARALVSKPKFLVADEVVSALDVSVQAEILMLLVELRERLSLTTLFISHNLDVVRTVSDRVAVMHLGRIVEIAPAAVIYAAAQHPYTRLLLSAMPGTEEGSAAERRARRAALRGEVEAIAGQPLREVGPQHLAAIP